MLVEDEVHGVVEIPKHVEEIVNHPQFQRLKNIKQLGLGPMAIYPKANHTRYEHCIGWVQQQKLETKRDMAKLFIFIINSITERTKVRRII